MFNTNIFFNTGNADSPAPILLAGGAFTTYNSNSANRIIGLELSGSPNTNFSAGTGANSNVYFFAPGPNGKVFAGGRFTTYDGVACNKLILINRNGVRDTSFDPSEFAFTTTYPEFLVTDSGGKYYVGGNFGNGAMTSFNSDGTVNATFNVTGLSGFSSGVPTTAVIINDVIYVGGSFTTYKGNSAYRIVAVNLDASRVGTFGNSFDFDGTINQIAKDSANNLYMVGVFTEHQGVSANRIVSTNSTNGNRNATFDVGTGFNNFVNSIFITDSDAIYVGGLFTTYKGVTGAGIVKLNTDGSRDTNFNPSGSGIESTKQVLAISYGTDDYLYIGGNFTTYNSTTVNGIAKVNPSTGAIISFSSGTGFNNLASGGVEALINI